MLWGLLLDIVYTALSFNTPTWDFSMHTIVSFITLIVWMRMLFWYCLPNNYLPSNGRRTSKSLRQWTLQIELEFPFQYKCKFNWFFAVTVLSTLNEYHIFLIWIFTNIWQHFHFIIIMFDESWECQIFTFHIPDIAKDPWHLPIMEGVF